MSAAEEFAQPRSILVALDDSRLAHAALERAIAIATSSGAWLTLLHVIEPPHPPPLAAAQLGVLIPPEPYEQAENLLERAAARVPETIPVHTLLLHGPAADQILWRVNAAGHDLVVIGSHGRGLVGSLVLGSLSRAIVRRSHVPVVVVQAD
jgi:nucleotide-binding universal stress UspA family protein